MDIAGMVPAGEAHSLEAPCYEEVLEAETALVLPYRVVLGSEWDHQVVLVPTAV